MEEKYSILLNRIDEFVRRFFLTRLFYGLAIFIGTISIIIGAALIIESKYGLEVAPRAIIFYGTILLCIYLFINFVLIPILAVLGIIKPLSRYKAARIIENRIDKVDDKLINFLELREQENYQNYSKELIEASIVQKANHLFLFKMQDVITKKHLFYRLLIPIVLGILVLLSYSFKKSNIKETATHYINYSVDYSKQDGFTRISVLNKNLKIEIGENLEIKAKIESKKENNRPVINYGSGSFHLKKDSANYYSYLFKSINNDFNFYISVGRKKSENYTIQVLPTPVLINFDVIIKPPSYTRKEVERLRNSNDIKIAEGSNVTWEFLTENVDTITVTKRNSNKRNIVIIEGRKGSFSQPMNISQQYSIGLINKQLKKSDLLSFNIEVVKDKFPEIVVNEFIDSTNIYGRYFIGRLKDDYGITKLYFKYFKDNNSSIKLYEVPIVKNIEQEFYYYIDYNEILKEIEEVNYYFEVWDNDEVNGSKYTRTQTFKFKNLSYQEVSQKSDSLFDSIEKELYEAINLTNDISNDIEKIKLSSFNNNLSNFEKKSLMEDIIMKKDKLDEVVKNLNKIQKEKSLLNDINKEQKEEIIDKQKKINELLEKLFTEEIRDLLEELRKLQEELEDDKDIKDLSENLEMNLKDLEKQMENSLELLKKFEVEKKIEEAITELKNIKNEIDSIDKNLSKENISDTTLIPKIEEKKQQLENVLKEYEKAQEMNDELKYSMNLQDFKEEKEKIDSSFNALEEKVADQKYKKAKESIDDTKDQLEDLAEKMQNMLDSNREEENTINIELLNRIIDNIVLFSFSQEELLQLEKSVSTKNPKYLEIYNDQQDLIEKFNFINEQLDTLSAKTPVVTGIINSDIEAIKEKNGSVIKHFELRNKSKVATDQQLIMTHANNLALKLNEILNNIEQSNSNSTSDKNCNKPSKPKPGLGDLKKKQDSFKNQLKNMIEQMKEGKGGKPQNSELAKMLAQQEIMRQLLNEVGGSEEIGKGAQQELNAIKKLMDENIKDIINKQIDNNLIQRQDLIKSRLLKAEKSEYEREEEKRRKSTENLVEKTSNPGTDFEYNKENYNFNELLENKSIKFKDFYNRKAKKYFEKISYKSQ